ncbi:MAG: alpha/beta fold hydrolase [Deltaproteobacteria bacterium]|nr:alpha/beta fold hydrolase [Deltaproteobacteria bacterium]
MDWQPLPRRDGHLAIAAAGPPQAPPVVLLHGFLADSRAWRQVVDKAALPERRWLAVDLPGHGASAQVLLAGAPDPWAAVGELVDRSLSEYLHGPFAVVGYSAGGRVAAWWALQGQMPKRLGLSALVLESAHPGLAVPAERAARWAQDQARAAELLAVGLPEFVAAWEQLPLFASQHRLGQDHTRLLAQKRIRLDQHPDGLVDHLRTLSTGTMPRLDDLGARADVPALVLAGQEDTAYCALAPRWLKPLPKAELRFVAGAGHNLHLEAPAAWQAAVAEALGRQ